MSKSRQLEEELRAFVQRAWMAGDTDLAIELEATAFRCFGINLDAERRARLVACDRRRKSGDPHAWTNSAADVMPTIGVPRE